MKPPALQRPSATLLVAIRKMSGDELDELVGRFVLHGDAARARGASSSWDGARRVTKALTAQGCDVVARLSAGKCLCRVSKEEGPKGATRELATAEAATFPEALARAALLACLEMPGS